ncbi:MAG TPA: DUF1565 domain-containing protein [Candidatus Cloacimonadota bacterium]|nr:DUF1565 domain-containing protein [Candidatus Cloacimonadota bacterium]HPT70796.1 DUF1565 domain-containing protein [Candidatus Cloacimonadota bacterium]
MKYLIIIWFALLMQTCYCFTWTVSLDGTHDLTSIQLAIDVSSSGDIIQVYPGVYAETLETNGKSITLQSLYPITLSQETINTTIIHPVTVSSCIEIDHGETVTINGFTITNNEPVNMLPIMVDANHDGYFGGCLEITDNSSVSILNCVIQNCMAPCGGIYFDGSSFYMSNTTVRDCIGTELGGGVTIEAYDDSNVVFDSIHPNSIYNNLGEDIFIRNVPNLSISLDTFSIILSEPDFVFFYVIDCPNIQINIQHQYLSLINQDLYVSPDGSDTNSGLSTSDPFQTIDHAIKVIQPDSLNPKTIHLAAGNYSIAGNNQYFPLRMKSHTRLIGDSSNYPILDENNGCRFFYLDVGYANDVEVSNLNFVAYTESAAPLGFGYSQNVKFSNLIMDGDFGSLDGFIGLSSSNIIIENVLIKNSSVDNLQNTAFRILFVDNLVINNCIVDNLNITDYDANRIGYELNDSDVTIRNSIISNCTGGDTTVFFYQNINEEDSTYNLDMSNMLIFNNYSEINDPWAPALVLIHNHFQRTQISNCTIANNNGSDTCPIQITGDADIRNCIFYNPDMYWDVGFITLDEGNQYHPSISNTLLHRTVAADNLSAVTQNEMINNSNPLFLGSTTDTLAITQPEYYYLSANSPCIDNGVADTTGLNIPLMDLAGNHRVWNNRIDMGCYEYGSEPVGNDDQTATVDPEKITLSTYPNPVYISGAKGGYVFLEFTLPERAKEPPLIEIFNIRGQRVKSMKLSESYTSLVHKAGLSNQVKQNGEFFSTVWDCRNDNTQKIASGLYIVRVTSGSQKAVKKMMVIH